MTCRTVPDNGGGLRQGIISYCTTWYHLAVSCLYQQNTLLPTILE